MKHIDVIPFSQRATTTTADNSKSSSSSTSNENEVSLPLSATFAKRIDVDQLPHEYAQWRHAVKKSLNWAQPSSSSSSSSKWNNRTIYDFDVVVVVGVGEAAGGNATAVKSNRRLKCSARYDWWRSSPSMPCTPPCRSFVATSSTLIASSLWLWLFEIKQTKKINQKKKNCTLLWSTEYMSDEMFCCSLNDIDCCCAFFTILFCNNAFSRTYYCKMYSLNIWKRNEMRKQYIQTSKPAASIVEISK